MGNVSILAMLNNLATLSFIIWSLAYNEEHDMMQDYLFVSYHNQSLL